MELELHLRFLSDPLEQDTYYFGGGTPSLLPNKTISSLVESAMKNAPLKEGGEFTLEVNPEDVNNESLSNWRKLGINRLSIGVQSFIDDKLKWMNRSHNSIEASNSILRAQDAGFENISIDLIYGIPNSSLSEWQFNVNKALEMKLVHLSTYALTVEKKTRLFYEIKKGESKPLSDERAEEDFRWYRDYLCQQGWDCYEISNSCIPGWRSIHNSRYWLRNPYCGIGPGAHSFDGGSIRRWNVSNNIKYQKSVGVNNLWYEEELLDKRDIINEIIMTRLRTREGLDSKILGKWSSDIEKYWRPHVDAKRLKKDKYGVWKLLDKGLFWADRIASDGFIS
tara:strand:+ start:3042 stop:4052 length:1011 start_codon:yes stop_codon:yes gene_type:complete